MTTLRSLLGLLGVVGVLGVALPRQEVCDTEDCQAAATTILENLDITTDPCEDFYRFACGGWMDSNVIPDGQKLWGTFYELDDTVTNQLKAVATSPEGSDSVAVARFKTMFDGCMDTDAIEAAGLGGILTQMGPEGDQGGWPMVQDSWAGQDKFQPSLAVGQIRRYLNKNFLLSLYVFVDDFDTAKNTIYIDQPDIAADSLGLPFSMYLDVESYSEYIAAYKSFMVESASVVARELGTNVTPEQLQQSADEIFEFERQIAQAMTPESDRRNNTAKYNPMLVSELKEQYGMLDWDAYLDAVFENTGVSVDDTERVIVVQPDYFLATQDLQTTPEVVSNYLHWRVVMSLATELTQEMRDIHFTFNSALTGVTTTSERWRSCVLKVAGPKYAFRGNFGQDPLSGYDGAFGYAAAHEFIKDYFDESSKELGDVMVGYIKSAFKELVEETDWMDAETKVKAQNKADLLLQLIGYPDWLPSVEKVDEFYKEAPIISRDDHFGNVVGMKSWLGAQDLKTLREEPDRGFWLMQPAVVNAWYLPNTNTITFPAGILQPPVFKGGYPRYLNYGAVGMVIGHELTHGFDDMGRYYDGTGNISPWWSQSTIENFIEKTQCFIDQYSNYSVPELNDILGEEDAHLNGKKTQGENIADNGGIHEAYRAYISSVESQGPEPALPGLEMYTSEQMLFISYAQVWCEINTIESLLNYVLVDPHAPGQYRVIGPLSNSEDFQREFNCPADSAMNRPEKCTLW